MVACAMRDPLGAAGFSRLRPRKCCAGQQRPGGAPDRGPRMAACAAIIMIMLALAGCASGGRGAGITDDPLIALNRTSHQINRALDRALLRPVSRGYEHGVPAVVKLMVENELDFLTLPVDFASALMMGEIGIAGEILARFLVNLSLGAGGLLDPATDMNIPAHDLDLGLALGRLGVGEGPYIELPLLGPTTLRDAMGRLLAIPVAPTFHTSGAIGDYDEFAALGASSVVTRYRLGGALDDIYDNAPDSYLTLRNFYLQNRRHKVSGGESSVEDLPDLFDSE